MIPISSKKDNLKIHKGFKEFTNQSNSSNSQSNPEPEQDSESGPEQDPDNDNFVQKTVDNNNFITVKPKHKFSLQHKLDLANLKSTPVSLIYNLSKDKIIILNEFKNKSGIYLIHNNVNGK